MLLKIKLRGQDVNPHMFIALSRIGHVSWLVHNVGLRAWYHNLDYKATYVAPLTMSSVLSALCTQQSIRFQWSRQQNISTVTQAVILTKPNEKYHLCDEPSSSFCTARLSRHSEMKGIKFTRLQNPTKRP